MARRSLSSQVIDEVERVRDILHGVAAHTDPLTTHMVETAMKGLRAIEVMCLSVQTDSELAKERRKARAAAAVTPATAAKPAVRKASTRARKAVVRGSET